MLNLLQLVPMSVLLTKNWKYYGINNSAGTRSQRNKSCCQYLKIVAQHVEVWSWGAPQDLAETNRMNLLLPDIHLDDRYVQTLH